MKKRSWIITSLSIGIVTGQVLVRQGNDILIEKTLSRVDNNKVLHEEVLLSEDDETDTDTGLTTTTRSLQGAANGNSRNFDPYILCPTRRSSRGTKYTIQKNKGQFAEVSYLVYSNQATRRNNHPIVWVGSDGKQNILSAVNLVTGQIIHTITFKNLKEKRGDYEALTLGPCTSQPNDKRTCIYWGDVGNNGATWCIDDNTGKPLNPCQWGRRTVKIHKFVEPNLRNNNKRSRTTVSTIRVAYDDPRLPVDRYDCESMFVDYTGDNVSKNNDGGTKGDLYMVTKFYGQDQLQRLVKIPVSAHENLRNGEEMTYSVQPVMGRNKPPFAFYDEYGSQWTDATMSTDGTLILLRDYYTIFFYPRTKYMTIADALNQEPCDVTSSTTFGTKEELYFEAVSISNNKRFLAEAPECTNPRKQMCDVKVTVYELSYNTNAIERNSFLLPLSKNDPPISSPPPPPPPTPIIRPTLPPVPAPVTSVIEVERSGLDTDTIDDTDAFDSNGIDKEIKEGESLSEKQEETIIDARTDNNEVTTIIDDEDVSNDEMVANEDEEEDEDEESDYYYYYYDPEYYYYYYYYYYYPDNNEGNVIRKRLRR